MSLIDPNLLQAVALGTKDDASLPDGRHVRWFFNRLLGFPRSGFRLRRRPSALTQDWTNPPGVPPTRRQATDRTALGTAGATLRFASGLTVAKRGGFAFGPVTAGGDPLLRIDDRAVTLAFGAEGAGPPPSGALLSNPAACVLLTVTRRARTGAVVASGFYDGQGARRFVDRGATGRRLADLRPDLAPAVIEGRAGAERVRSAADRVAGLDAASRRDAAASAALAAGDRRLRWPRLLGLFDVNPWLTETLLLHGGLLEHVDVVGRDAALVQVQWITTRDELATPDWTDLGTFRLPLTDAPAIYPAWTSDPGAKVARQRLALAPPKTPAPWDEPSGSVLSALERRYVGTADEEFEQTTAAMRTFLEGELTRIVPQALVEVTEALEPEPGDGTGPEAMQATVSPFDLLYAAAADPQVARILGLMTTDSEDPAGIFDYAVEAGFPLLWLQWLLNPRAAHRQAEELREALGGAPFPWDDQAGAGTTTAPTRRPFAPHPCVSLVTGIARSPVPPPEAPADLALAFEPDALLQPVQGRMQVSWRRETGTLFEHPERVRVLYAFRRDPQGAAALLHHRDEETGLLAPHLPTPHADGDHRLRLVDRRVPSYGLHTWEVSGMDLFGRMSPFAGASADVRDVLPPPPPTAVAAEIVGAASSAPVWTRLSVRFEWPAAHASLAPDLARFELHVRLADVPPADASLATTWGRLEHEPGATTAPLDIAWPTGTVSPTAAPVTVASSVEALADGGHRITVALGPLRAPFDPEGFAVACATVRAVDTAGNASAFATPGRALRADETPPPPPPAPEEAQRSTIPDARNRSFYRVPLPAGGDGFLQVMRAAGAALLAGDGTSAAVFEALTEPQQVAHLKALGAAHPEVFAPDHEAVYPAGTPAHVIEIGGFDRGYTVATVLPMSKTHVRASWPVAPAQFLVIRVPHPAAPRTPLVRRVRPGDRSVHLEIEVDPTGATRALQLYRARTAQEAADVRRMRPLPPIDIPPPGTEPVEVADTGLWPDVNYLYRVVAVAADGTRSLPTEAFVARAYASAPDPPQIGAIERDAAVPARRAVTCIVPRRDYRLRLFRRAVGALAWESPAAPGVTADGVVDLSGLSPALHASGGYALIVLDTVPEPDRRYAYFAHIEDPRGAAAESAPRLEETGP